MLFKIDREAVGSSNCFVFKIDRNLLSPQNRQRIAVSRNRFYHCIKASSLQAEGTLVTSLRSIFKIDKANSNPDCCYFFEEIFCDVSNHRGLFLIEGLFDFDFSQETLVTSPRRISLTCQMEQVLTQLVRGGKRR